MTTQRSVPNDIARCPSKSVLIIEERGPMFVLHSECKDCLRTAPATGEHVVNMGVPAFTTTCPLRIEWHDTRGL